MTNYKILHHNYLSKQKRKTTQIQTTSAHNLQPRDIICHIFINPIRLPKISSKTLKMASKWPQILWLFLFLYDLFEKQIFNPVPNRVNEKKQKYVIYFLKKSRNLYHQKYLTKCKHFELKLWICTLQEAVYSFKQK